MLQVEVERGIDLQSTLMHIFTAIFLFQRPPYLLRKVRRQRIPCWLQCQSDGKRARRVRLYLCDLSVLRHGAEYQVPALESIRGVQDRRIKNAALGQRSQHRGFFQREVAELLVEIILRACGESIYTVAQIDLVGIHGEDLWLGESPLDLDGEECLLYFAAQC